MFECIVAGTSLAPDVPLNASNGIGINHPHDWGSPSYGEKILDDEGQPDGLKWQATFPAGVMILASNCILDKIVITGFTGFGVVAQSNLDPETYASAFGFADFTYVNNHMISFCGAGIRFNGSDANGGSTFQGNFLFLGLGRSNVDGPTYLDTDPDTWGNGGCGIHDRGLGGNSHYKSYLQFCGAVPYRNDTLAMTGSAGAYHSCTAETTFKCFFIGFPVLTNCTPLPLTGGGIYLSSVGRGIQEEDNTGPVPTHAKISNGLGGLWTFSTPADLNNEWGWKYDVAGYWKLHYSGPYSTGTAFRLSSIGVGTNPGPAWVGFDRGFMIGDDPAAAIFRGTLEGLSSVVGRLKDRSLRAGLRRIGDRFEGVTATVTITSEGYRGEPWTALAGGIDPGVEGAGIAPYIVEPTANGVWPAAGGSVWKCSAVTTAITGAIEPVWSTATPDGGTSPGDTIVDAGVTWELLGFTPHFDVEQRTDKATIPTRLTKKQTTTSTASQVIESGGVVDSVDLALPPNSMVIVTDLITLKKSATADGGAIEVKSTWVRNGTSAPVEIGAHVPVYNLSGATLDGTTVVHAANGNRIELRGSPETAETLNWRVFRTQATGED